MTKAHSNQKWQTVRVWPGGGWGEALAQVRRDQHLSQRDVADYVGVNLGMLRKWEEGLALPDRAQWPQLEEAMGIPVPDPRVPDHTPAERELIDTMLLLIDELRLLRERIAEAPTVSTPASPKVEDPKMLDVKRAAECLGVSTSFIRNLAAQRSLVHYKLGGRVMFRREDIDQYVDQNKRELPDQAPWQLRDRRGKTPRVRSATPAKPTRSRRSTSPKESKREMAEKRWTVEEFAEKWYGVDGAMALLERAGIQLEVATEGSQTFRHGDLVSWMEANTVQFEEWLGEYDPVLKRREDREEGPTRT